MSDPVVMALRAAVQARDGVELRVALGSRLLALGQAGEALAEFERGLALQPSNAGALDGAARAAAAAGDAVRAEAYRLALHAHGSRPAAPDTDATLHVVAAPPPAPPAPPRVVAREVPVHEAPVPDRPPARAAHEPGQASSGQPKLRLVGATESAPEVAAITFADIGGLTDVKDRLQRSFLLPLQQPELFARFNKSLRGGLLLYGPPGCGKTFIARALAGELGARFLSVGLSDVLDMWLGESERKLHELFENARRAAPCVLFFDEVDALGQRRTQLKHSAGRNLVNQLLSEMDGIGSRNRDLFVLGATNHPWDVDTALRRPGRFDRMLFVPAPDAEARCQILSLKLRERPCAASLDLGALAARTDGYSGADLQALVDAATELAFEQSVASGRERAIDDALLHTALRDIKASTRPWLETARNYAVYANEGGTYDDLLSYLKARNLA